MQDDLEKWNRRYAGSDFFLGRKTSSFLADSIGLILRMCRGRRALDLACGEGRNSIFLARNGFQVTGVDISEVGLAKARQWAAAEHLAIDFRQIDLDSWSITDSYDLIINFNFLIRRFFPEGYAALAPDGVMVVDTILNSPFVPTSHATEFLLRPAELLSTFSRFPGAILHAEERPFTENPTAKILFWKHEY